MSFSFFEFVGGIRNLRITMRGKTVLVLQDGFEWMLADRLRLVRKQEQVIGFVVWEKSLSCEEFGTGTETEMQS